MWLVVTAVVAAAGAGLYLLRDKLPTAGAAVTLEQATERMLASEDLYLHATIRLKRLSKSIKNLDLPDPLSRHLFAEEVLVNDLTGGPSDQPQAEYASVGIQIREWPVAKSARTVPGAEFSMWAPLLEQVDYFDHAKFFIIDAHFDNDEHDPWWTSMGFDALARGKNGKWIAYQGKMEAVWERNPAHGDSLDAYRIREWKLLSMTSAEAERLPFEEVVDRAIPDVDARRRAKTSIQEILVTRFLRDLDRPPAERTFNMPSKYFRPPAQDRHPGVAVVDIDQDGLDDFYVMNQWGRNLLFRNRGDGTFEDVAPRYGLDLKDHCTAACFADFDNDGDPDVFIGRSLERSVYLVNENGRFVDRSRELAGGALPYLVSAVTAADYDGDGLLDLYVSTYASDAMRTDLTELREAARLSQSMIQRNEPPPAMRSPLADFLSAADARHLHELRTDPKYGYHGYRNAYGPPNLLLKNQGGGRLAEDPQAGPMRAFRHTYQATWADYDGDGDPDLYLANDFAPNNMLRNDGGRFVDVTEETGTADIGFGMGVSWGDYDGDGRQDLYVSNMFSKAGRRITKQVPGLDPIFSAMARGNTLFRNTGARFDKVSGTDPGTVLVEAAGWSWGSQFCDFDNDGWLDVYALSGHYTAPKQVESQVDI